MDKGVLFIAPPGAGKKREPLFREIVSMNPGNDYSSVLYLAPNSFVTSAAGSDFFSYVQTHHKQNAFIPFQFQTIRQFAEGLHDTCSEHGAITDRLRVLILSEILKEKKIGYATILSDLYKKIRHYLPGAPLEQVKEKIGNLIFEEKAAERAVKAIDVLQKYAALLKEKNLRDPEGLLAFVNDAGRDITHAGSTLVIDGFFDPTPLELEIMGLLIDKAERVFVLAEEETEIIRFLMNGKKEITVQRSGAAEYREKTAYYSYPSLEEEVEGIAKNIRKLIIEGTMPWEIMVSFPVLTKYLPMLKRILPKYGIPISISEYRLSATRPFIALEEMITCIEGEYSRSDFLSFLTSSHFPAIPAVIKEKAVSYAYRAGVVRGADSWLAVRDTLMNAGRGDISDDEKRLLNDFQHGITMIINTIEDIKGKKEAGPFIDAFESALAKFGFFDSLTGMHGEKMLNRISGQFSEFRYFVGLYGAGSRMLNTPVFYLKYLLANLTASEENRDGVKITPFELAAGIETKVLFFGGILEGDLPSRPDIDPILPERVKKELGMPFLEYYLKRQKRYFTRLLNVSVHDPYFSCPSAEGDKIFLPSPFLDWEQNMPPLEPDIFSEEEVLIREGAIRRSPQGPGIFNDKEMFRSKKAHSLLLRRIGAMSKGFLSVTDIDFYRKCPLRFYIEKVLGLEVITPPRFEVEARLWGTLAHRTMEHVFEAGSIEPEDLGQKISEGLEKSLKQFPIGDFWAKVAKEIFQKLLPSLKAEESDIKMRGFVPYRMEEKLTADLDGLKLKGKVDRVDIRRRSPDAEQRTTNNEQRPTVALLDYKTGNIDRNSLQLPLYAAMWQRNFSEPVEHLGYYSLKEGRVTRLPGKISMDEFIQNAVQSAQELIAQIREGRFSAEPFRADECRYCHHSPLCHK